MIFRTQRFTDEHFNKGANGTAIKILYLMTDLDFTGGLTREEYEVKRAKDPSLEAFKQFTFSLLNCDLEKYGISHGELEVKIHKKCNYEILRKQSNQINRKTIFTSLEQAILKIVDYKKYQDELNQKERDEVKLLIAQSIYKYLVDHRMTEILDDERLDKIFQKDRKKFGNRKYFYYEPWAFNNSSEYKFNLKILSDPQVLARCIANALITPYQKIMHPSVIAPLKSVPLTLFAKQVASIKHPLLTNPPLTKLIHGYYEDDQQSLDKLFNNVEFK